MQLTSTTLGSVQQISDIPTETRKLFSDVWEVPQRRIVDLAAGRLPWICQGQTMPIYLENASNEQIVSLVLLVGDVLTENSTAITQRVLLGIRVEEWCQRALRTPRRVLSPCHLAASAYIPESGTNYS